MKIVIDSNRSGKFNLCSNESEFYFQASIRDDARKVLEIDGTKAIIAYMGEATEDEDFFNDDFSNFGEVMAKCYDYCTRIMSSRDYEGECNTFLKVFAENKAKFIDNVRLDEEKKQKRIIADAQAVLDDLDSLDFYVYPIVKKLEDFASIRDKWVDSATSDLAQFVPGSAKAIAEEKRLEKYAKERDAARILAINLDPRED